MSTPPAQRPGGRSERIRQAVLAAADELAERGGEVTVAALAERSGVTEVTIYRRWRSADNVLLDAAVRDVGTWLPIATTGDLRADLADWARRVESSLTTLRGRRLLAAAFRVRLSLQEISLQEKGEEPAMPYLKHRGAQIQQLIDAADPPAQVTVPQVLDRVLAPIYLRYLFGYQPSSSVEQLVSDLLDS
ncbi:MAG TPA: TetR/AcrR family transcriptional regulator [Trebonia sp.]